MLNCGTMKNILIAIAVVLLGVLAWYFFIKNDEATTNPEDSVETESEMNADLDMPIESGTTMETGTYKVASDDSAVTWQAGKPAIAGYVHTGTFDIESGDINLTDGELSGEFVIDINSLQVTSLGGGKVGQESALEEHLKSERFFDVTTYPTATFTVTDVSPKILPGPGKSDYNATGELTLKGKTNSISFPMKVLVANEDEVWMTAALTIDRTLWGIDFGSASVAEKITDNIIGDDVTMNLMMKLEK